MLDIAALWIGRVVLAGSGILATVAFLWWSLEIVFKRLKWTADVFQWAYDRAIRRRDRKGAETGGNGRGV